MLMLESRMIGWEKKNYRDFERIIGIETKLAGLCTVVLVVDCRGLTWKDFTSRLA